MNDSIRPDKEDRYVSESSPKKTVSPKSDNPLLSKRKWIILVLLLLIILLSLSFVIFRTDNSELSSQQNNTNAALNNNAADLEYQTIVPPKISREATQTQQNTVPDKERIEIPGEVADILADKITELNTHSKSSETIVFEGQNNNIDQNIKELPLQKGLENTHYTIQITSSSSLESIMTFVKQQKLSNYQIYETRREQKPWFVLIKGNYPTIEEAKEAAKLLPQDLQKSTPWIKSGAQVNKEKLSQ